MRPFSAHLLSLAFIGLRLHIAAAEQIVIPSVPMDTFERPMNTLPTLFDVLTIEPSTSIFFSYARELELSRMFVENSTNLTVLVPTNKAVMALARKPHQDPDPADGKIEMTEQEFDERSKNNVERWVSLHIIPESPIPLLSRTYPTFAEGKTVTFKETNKNPDGPEWSRVLINGEIGIIGMREASNGIVYVIDGTVQGD
ncbi:hypothetical protein BC834DRAFT_841122 [Gloeopeniophorella convolvens]|nr:hypothetical protein BC834DRAFT_841122 [Gloeopeniophorella convolvens]